MWLITCVCILLTFLNFNIKEKYLTSDGGNSTRRWEVGGVAIPIFIEKQSEASDFSYEPFVYGGKQKRAVLLLSHCWRNHAKQQRYIISKIEWDVIMDNSTSNCHSVFPVISVFSSYVSYYNCDFFGIKFCNNITCNALQLPKTDRSTAYK